MNSEDQPSQPVLQAPAEPSPASLAVSLNRHEITAGQRLMVWAMVAWVIGFFPPAIFMTIPFQLYAVFRLTRALKISGLMISLLMLSVLVPIFCGLVFVGLYVRAGRTLQGMEVEPS